MEERNIFRWRHREFSTRRWKGVLSFFWWAPSYIRKPFCYISREVALLTRSASCPSVCFEFPREERCACSLPLRWYFSRRLNCEESRDFETPASAFPIGRPSSARTLACSSVHWSATVAFLSATLKGRNSRAASNDREGERTAAVVALYVMRCGVVWYYYERSEFLVYDGTKNIRAPFQPSVRESTCPVPCPTTGISEK